MQRILLLVTSVTLLEIGYRNAGHGWNCLYILLGTILLTILQRIEQNILWNSDEA